MVGSLRRNRGKREFNVVLFVLMRFRSPFRLFGEFSTNNPTCRRAAPGHWIGPPPYAALRGS